MTAHACRRVVADLRRVPGLVPGILYVVTARSLSHRTPLGFGGATRNTKGRAASKSADSCFTERKAAYFSCFIARNRWTGPDRLRQLSEGETGAGDLEVEPLIRCLGQRGKHGDEQPSAIARVFGAGDIAERLHVFEMAKGRRRRTAAQVT